MTEREALKLAQELLESAHVATDLVWKRHDAITAIKEALAQPEPWEKFCDSNCVWTDHHPDCKLAQRKPLTDKQILADETLRYYFGLNGGAGPVSKQGRRIVNAIEAAHGIKGEA